MYRQVYDIILKYLIESFQSPHMCFNFLIMDEISASLFLDR